ncbi:hypothetical protein [Diaphorobacter aerolatus]|uniref:Uncharacterized protein n=1 Tax=Diaphorobacter aerolatus TaxID=1288495 RepID=A0A7H0GI04_9BURK|nr:hypothetical protein [Diaphorobacter aerolatus]QNP47920.1 hypothetical protein H9K75_17615 [Diaphorobacter aerolatus]
MASAGTPSTRQVAAAASSGPKFTHCVETVTGVPTFTVCVTADVACISAANTTTFTGLGASLFAGTGSVEVDPATVSNETVPGFGA